MRSILSSILALSGAVFLSFATSAQAARSEIIVSVPDQRLELVQDGVVLKRYPVSTSRYGVGDSWGSYRTPLGQLKICDKIGGGLPEGAVLKHRSPTGEILAPNAKGRDPIVTRIMWLDGMEAGNANARERGVYIHGSPVEKLIGKPASYGCIRMRSRDVVELYNAVPVGTVVTITKDKLDPAMLGLGQMLVSAGSSDPRPSTARVN